MPQPLERRKKLRQKAVQPTGPTWVLLENVPGARADIRAKVVDFSETGLRVHVSLWLRASRLVVVKGDAGVVPNGKANARVVDCRPLAGSGYTAGLTFVESPAKNTGDETWCGLLRNPPGKQKGRSGNHSLGLQAPFSTLPPRESENRRSEDFPSHQ
jgi:hypothetical protein